MLSSEMGSIPSSPTIPRCPPLRDGDFPSRFPALLWFPYSWRILGRPFWSRRQWASCYVYVWSLWYAVSTLRRSALSQGTAFPTGILFALVLVLLGGLSSKLHSAITRLGTHSHQVGDRELPGSRVLLPVWRGFDWFRLHKSRTFHVAGDRRSQAVHWKPRTGPAHKGHCPKNWPSSGIPLVVAGGFSAAFFMAKPLTEVTTRTFLSFLVCVKFKGSRGPTVKVAVLTFLEMERRIELTRRSPDWGRPAEIGSE